MARPPAAAGFIAACFRRKTRTCAAKREPKDLLGHGWGFAWPNDCRIIYNRASARPDGKPWSERKKLVWWDEEKKQWTGLTMPDFDKDMPPDLATRRGGSTAMDAIGGRQAVHPASGWCGLAVRRQRIEGRPAAHALRAAGIAGLESAVSDAAYQSCGQIEKSARTILMPRRTDARFPYVLTTYRLTEHHTAGGMSRDLIASGRTAAGAFLRVSPELAEEIGHRAWRVGDHCHGPRDWSRRG